MLGLVDFIVSYAQISCMRSLCIIIAIAYAEGLIIFVLDIFNSLQNSILTNPEERAYLSLPHLYLKWFKIKWPKHPLASINKNELCIQEIKSILGKNLMGNSSMKN